MQQAINDSVIIDAGHEPHWTPGGTVWHLAGVAARSYLVCRSCYLAVRRAVLAGRRPSGVIVLHEPGRSLHTRDVIDVAAVAGLTVDSAIARAVGLVNDRPLPASGPGLEQLRWLSA